MQMLKSNFSLKKKSIIIQSKSSTKGNVALMPKNFSKKGLVFFTKNRGRGGTFRSNVSHLPLSSIGDLFICNFHLSVDNTIILLPFMLCNIN